MTVTYLDVVVLIYDIQFLSYGLLQPRDLLNRSLSKRQKKLLYHIRRLFDPSCGSGATGLHHFLGIGSEEISD